MMKRMIVIDDGLMAVTKQNQAGITDFAIVKAFVTMRMRAMFMMKVLSFPVLFYVLFVYFGAKYQTNNEWRVVIGQLLISIHSIKKK